MKSLYARLIVWEGPKGDERCEQKRIQRWHKNLRSAINKHFEGTGWRFHRFNKTKPSTTGTYKLEIYLVHPEIPSFQQTNAKLRELCTGLLDPSLNVELQLLDIIDSFTFSPSQEGILNTTDKAFARHFSIALLETYCTGNTISDEMEMIRETFLRRNTTKYLHYPMIAICNVAEFSDHYSDYIGKMIIEIEELNGHSEAELAPDVSTTPAQNKVTLKVLIAYANRFARAFVAFAPEIKKKLKPQLEILNTRVLEGRLFLASEAYLTASTGPIAALKHLYSLDSPSVDDLAITINTFGNLMQTALPLFEITLAVSDAEFAAISTLSMAASASLIGTGALILTAGAATAGSAVLLVAAAGLGTAAIHKGVKWRQRLKTNPSILLLAIQKSLEECSRYILGLLFMAAEKGGGEDSSHLDGAQALRDSLSNDDFAKPGYMKAYYKTLTKKLEKDMGNLRIGLEGYRNELKAKNGTNLT